MVGFLDFFRRDPRKRRCAHCSQPAAHGYSQNAESDVKEITPLCPPCLSELLQRDYGEFNGRALVIAPAAGLPCYAFRDVAYLESFRRGWKNDLGALSQTTGECTDCKSEARCLWITSRGLTIETFGDVLENGLQQTLLAWGNSDPIALCGKCTAQHIAEALQGDGVSFFEVCGPHGTEQGMVLPMAY